MNIGTLLVISMPTITALLVCEIASSERPPLHSLWLPAQKGVADQSVLGLRDDGTAWQNLPLLCQTFHFSTDIYRSGRFQAFWFSWNHNAIHCRESQ
jgi:hypothetical protein